jgi:hypothetical protein
MSALEQNPAAAPDLAAAFAPTAAPSPSATSSSLGASAFTQGSEVSFSPSPGLATLAHEAAHVVQQGSAAPFEGMYS